MPRKSNLELPPIDLGKETIGTRITRLRKKLGLTQIQMSEKIGVPQNMISAYERDKLRAHPEMLARFAITLNTTTDYLIGLKNQKKTNTSPDLGLPATKRFQKIESLPDSQKKMVYQTIDTMLKGMKNS